MIKNITIGRVISIVVVGFLLYILIGAIVPFISQPTVTDKTKEEVEQTNFYGEDYISERAYLVADNGDALEERMRMISQAEDRIILSTFQFYADDSGKAILASLREAAKRGVKVQLIVDGVSEIAQTKDSKYFYALAETENVEFKIYNPISLLRPWSINGRLHDKYMITDDNLYILGGRNIFGYFLGTKSDYKNYDWDVLVYNSDDTIGQSMEDLLNYFDEVWVNPTNKDVKNKLGFIFENQIEKAGNKLDSIYRYLQEDYSDWLEATDYYDKTKPVKKIELLVNPTTPYAKEPTVFYTMTQLMKEAEEDVVFHTPYIIANDWMMEELEDICKQVPSVTMMTNSVSNNGNPFGSVDYKQHKGKILDTGVQILEYDSGVSYHGKCFVIDDRLSSVGAFNWDMRSTYIDTETMLVIDSEEFNEDLRKAMNKYEEKALIVVDEKNSIIPDGHEPQTSSIADILLMGFAAILKIFLRFLF